MIDNIIDADDFVKCSNAMSKIKDVLDLRSKEDRDEQRARIEKLRKEAQSDNEENREVNVIFDDDLEKYSK
jgi:C4-type Zn-finger protein